MANKRQLGRTALQISPLVFGGNVFGWTADKTRSFELLDRFVEAGFETIDTADVYSAWAPGNQGGESETIIGEWLATRRNRDRVVIITKVGSGQTPGRKGLSAKWIEQGVEESLRRLQTDHIDLYFSHRPDPDTLIEETLTAHDKLIRAGKVRYIGASNYDADQLAKALKASKALNVPRYDVLQPEYNLYNRNSYEGPLRDVAVKEGLGVITYYALASGFLSGKYRKPEDAGQSARGKNIVTTYLNERGLRILKALDEIAKALNATQAEVALAWQMNLGEKGGVTAPIASATSLPQLESLIRSAQFTLTAAQMAELDKASAY